MNQLREKITSTIEEIIDNELKDEFQDYVFYNPEHQSEIINPIATKIEKEFELTKLLEVATKVVDDKLSECILDCNAFREQTNHLRELANIINDLRDRDSQNKHYYRR